MLPALRPPIEQRKRTNRLSSDSHVRFRVSAGATRPGVSDRVIVASLVDDVSNRLQVVLGYAQILHELTEDERRGAVQAIERECHDLRTTLRTLTGWTRDEGGLGPWQDDDDQNGGGRSAATGGAEER